MTNPSGDRIDRIESLLESFIAASLADRQASNDRMTRLEQTMESNHRESNDRMTRLEQAMEANYRESNERLTRIEQVVESNNKFLESFSTDLRRYTDSMNNLATRIDGVIATANQDRQETNSRLAGIQRQVSAIARHLGVI